MSPDSIIKKKTKKKVVRKKKVLKVKIKKLEEAAVVPSYANEGDAGLDLTAISCEVVGCVVCYGTGLSVEIPKGHVGYIFPRSSIFKKEMRLSNSVGVIDSGYRGEIKFMFDISSAGLLAKMNGIQKLDEYQLGDRIGQLVIMPIPKIEFEVSDDLKESDRGKEGFGSSGE